jgi:hypothetical protein
MEDEEDSHQSYSDPSVDMIGEWIEGRNDLFHRVLNSVNFQNRHVVMNNMLSNEYAFIGLMNRIHSAHIRQSTMTAYVTLSVPNPNATGFMEPVPIIPTSQQIANAITTEGGATGPIGNCAICQDSIEEDIARIRHCGHVYHRTCLNGWFETNPRCPVCRYDIREMDQAVGTSAVVAQTSSQSSGPSGAR